MSESIATLDQALGRAAKLHRLLREAGLSENALQMPINDPEMRRRLVRFWARGCYEATPSQKLAREIMGQNFFGIEEAVWHFDVVPTSTQLSGLSEIPYTEAELREVKDTHLLVAVFPLSILDMKGKVDFFYARENALYNKKAFAKDKGGTSWALVRRTPALNSTSKTWAEQQALLAENEETPKARIVVYSTIGHFLATGERLFQDVYVRCADLHSDDFQGVFVGSFDANGLYINCYLDDHRNIHIGVASARLPGR